mmetsp:Transcript_3600/g.14961  ORF Transcript_3600/g.14961 Transcript_3600/m.14961 type:complete len:276 (+) Transcript_3600:1371-2198(+)
MHQGLQEQLRPRRAQAHPHRREAAQVQVRGVRRRLRPQQQPPAARALQAREGEAVPLPLPGVQEGVRAPNEPEGSRGCEAPERAAVQVRPLRGGLHGAGEPVPPQVGRGLQGTSGDARLASDHSWQRGQATTIDLVAAQSPLGIPAFCTLARIHSMGHVVHRRSPHSRSLSSWNRCSPRRLWRKAAQVAGPWPAPRCNCPFAARTLKDAHPTSRSDGEVVKDRAGRPHGLKRCEQRRSTRAKSCVGGGVRCAFLASDADADATACEAPSRATHAM